MRRCFREAASPPGEHLNLAAVALISEMLQVLFVSAAIWLFYVVLGALQVNAEVREAWLLIPDDVESRSRGSATGCR